MPELLRVGTLLYAIGILLLAAMDAFVKLIGTDVAVGQVWLFRASVAFLPVLLFVRFVEGQRLATALHTQNLGLQVLRGFFGAATFLTIVLALRVSELAAVAIFGLTSPLIMIVIGVLFLRERVRPVLIGLSGLACCAAFAIVPTSGDIVLTGAAWAFLSALCHAFAAVIGRILMRKDAPSTMALYTNIVAMFCAVFVATLGSWTPMSSMDFMYCVVVGLLGGGSYLCLAIAIKHIELSQASLLEYTVYIWAVLFGFSMFAETPSIIQVLSAVVICSCAIAIDKLNSD